MKNYRETVKDILSRIPMRLTAEIAQKSYESFNWYGNQEYKILYEEAEKIAKEWDKNFKLEYIAAI